MHIHYSKRTFQTFAFGMLLWTGLLTLTPQKAHAIKYVCNCGGSTACGSGSCQTGGCTPESGGKTGLCY